MLLEDQYSDVVEELLNKGFASLELGCGEVFITLLSHKNKIQLSGTIFFSQGYIPPRVRAALSHPPKESCSKSFVTTTHIEENNNISLLHLGICFHPTVKDIKKTLDAFCSAVYLWREYLDDEGRKDLIPVSAP